MLSITVETILCTHTGLWKWS